MNSPYNGRFAVTQKFLGTAHQGLDLVGLDSKEIHSTVKGTVIRAGWENPNDHSQGGGLRVVIKKDGTKLPEFYYFFHLSKILVYSGDHVEVGQLIGIEGNTGHVIASPGGTGSHCHYEMRLYDSKTQFQNISAISGIPNVLGIYDDGHDLIKYSAHVQSIGWQDYVSDGIVAGTTGKALRLEALKIKLDDLEGDIIYQGHVQGEGWLEEVANDAICGTIGKSIRLEAVKIRLIGEVANKYDIYYQTHVQNVGWMGWVKNGEQSGTTGKSLRLEAIRIALVLKDQQPPQ